MSEIATSRQWDYRQALMGVGYEVLPFRGTFENVLDHVPLEIPLTVTASPQKGLEATVDLATQLATAGYRVAPHLSARSVESTGQLDELLTRLREAQIDGLFIVGGDGTEQGPFVDALGLLRHIREFGHHFADIGIGGYPDGHALIEKEALIAALVEKAPLANHITTQMCFDASKIRSWARALPSKGVDLPVRVGVPGAVSRQKLVRISASIGIQDSARFLRKQRELLRKFFTPGGFHPGGLVRKLAPEANPGTPDSPIAGFHLFTFNDLKGTEEWRQGELNRLGERGAYRASTES